MDRPVLRALLVDDDSDDFLVISELLAESKETKFALEWASGFEEACVKITHGVHDVYLVDYRLGAHTGLELLREAADQGITAPIIMLTGHGDREVDLQSMEMGAADYLVKSQLTSHLLERSIRYSIYRTQTLQALKQQDRLASVGLLASSLAHEIGTPLGVIRGRAEYLAMQAGGDPNIQKNVDVIVSQIDRVAKLIRSLLGLARGDSTGRAGPIRLNQAVAEVAELMDHEFRKYGIVFEDRLASASSAITIRGEVESLHQIFLNLLVNSVHAIETAHEQGRVSGHRIAVTAQESEQQWTISIEDTGCGISRTNLQNLFKPFFTTKDIGKGTGLGLVTSYKTILSWGGSITVESKEGVGTVFRLAFRKA